ncbi:hypothetical protein EW146_g150 [Bondarzewia mesenterica]|uniref:Oxidase ustYa n=1 Tax=Bondarzewia mesenterica TaxID=1095465 RepID=A0A4S4M9U2_9AGAM|nr:hypothetical protein EW146_g150 [Bondarzewia mesenterica]
MQMRIETSLAAHILWVVGALNVCLTLWRCTIILVPSLTGEKATEVQYTYAGDDYPLYYPIDRLDTIAMTLHESIHFALNSTDSVAHKEWTTISVYPEGFGRARLGPEHRLFVVSFYHQMHCLRQIQLGLLSRDDPIANPHHIQHCLNYLRQTFLCGAADSLEKGDFMKRNYEKDRVGDTLVCRDWEKVYGELGENYERWLGWREKWN